MYIYGCKTQQVSKFDRFDFESESDVSPSILFFHLPIYNTLMVDYQLLYIML